MSNYTKTVDFAAKDGLSSGASGKLIKGTEFETEFDNIATAIATKADTAGPTFTGTTTYATLNDGTTALTSTVAELNALDGITAVVGELNALDLGSTAVGTAIASKAVILDANKDYTGVRNLTLAGDLTIGGDDLTMGTNTAGHLLIADGTNFNPVAVGSLSEISTVATDDVFIAVDTSGGGLKKITRSTIVAGLATSSAISNVSEDSSPQLGGNLDLNGNDIVTTSNATLDLAPNGTGTVVVRGNTNSGAIVLNCESNTHGQKLYAQPHSAAVTNTLMLPAGANSTLVSLVSTDTLTNKTLTSPKINEDVAVTATATELNKLDGAGTLKQAGLETIYVPAAAMYPNTTAGCAALAQVELSNGPELKCLDFDASSDENAQFTVAFPKSWNEGTVTFQAFFTVTGTNTGTVAWGLSGVSFADNASINTAFGTNVVATAKAHSGTSNDINVTAVSGAVTITNAAVDTQTYFQIMRDVSADDQSGDARLLGIKLFFTTDAANDA